MDHTNIKLLIPIRGLKKSPSLKNYFRKDKIKQLDQGDSAKKLMLSKSKLFKMKNDKAIYNSAERRTTSLTKLEVKKDIYGHIKSKIGSLKDNNKITYAKQQSDYSEKETKTETASLEKKDSKSCII
jgi:hypothetical protein